MKYCIQLLEGIRDHIQLIPPQYSISFVKWFKINKIFRDRPVNETFIISRNESMKYDEIADMIGSSPCPFSCFEIINNFKMLNLFQYRKSKTRVDQHLVVGPKNNAKH